MARFFVFSTQVEAEDAVESVNSWARLLYVARGYEVDDQGAVIGKNALTGADEPAATRTETWDVPRQRADGLWIVAHTETCPGHDLVIDANGTLAWQFVMQGITAPVEEYDSSWFPLPVGRV
jgi:hypothetical protein